MLRLLLASCALVVSFGCEKKTPMPDPPAVRVVASSRTDGGPAAVPPKLEMVEIPEVRVRPDAPTTVLVTWIAPPGTAVNDEAPFRVRWTRSDGLSEAPSDVRSTGSTVKNGFRVKVKPMAGVPNMTLDGEIDIVVCDSVTHSVCVPVRRGVDLGFVVAKDAAVETTVSIPLPAAR